MSLGKENRGWERLVDINSRGIGLACQGSLGVGRVKRMVDQDCLQFAFEALGKVSNASSDQLVKLKVS
jgi:hypothetical protein